MSDEFQVVRAHPLLTEYVDDLQTKNSESLSFYPRQVFEREVEIGRIFLGLLNGEPCGYIYVGSNAKQDVRCHQVCIEYDARRRLYGAALVVAMEDYAQEGNALSISLRCGFDLEANDFWHSMGYGCIATQEGGARRGRTINVWRKQLQETLFGDFIEPAIGSASQGAWKRHWKKHGSTGILTQFHRGDTLREYRATIMEDDS